MQLCLFEDQKCSNFNPLTLTRPADDLRTGILTIAEKWQIALNTSSLIRCIRPQLKHVFASKAINKNKPCLWINSRHLPSKNVLDKINHLKSGSSIKSNGSVVVAKVTGQQSAQWLDNNKPNFSTLKAVSSVSSPHLNRLWDLFLLNKEEIAADIERLGNPNSVENRVSSKAVLQNKDNIFIGKGAQIEAGAILTANKGPIYVGRNAQISAGAIIQGPAAICESAVIKLGAKIRPNTTVGPVCTVGGEVSRTIFHSYSNKGHDGYAGNSLIGQWCNLGAGTNISNLKNNYSAVRVIDWDTQTPIETDQQSLGTTMGDHTKTAIGTRLNTGTVCGVNCNIFAADFPPKFIPSFSWVGSDDIVPYKLDKAFETMKAMMGKRDIVLTENYKRLMQHIFEKRYE